MYEDLRKQLKQAANELGLSSLVLRMEEMENGARTSSNKL